MKGKWNRPWARWCLLALLSGIVLLGTGTVFSTAQQATAPPSAKGQPGKPAEKDFAAAADEVLQQMSEITGLTLQNPLKKTLRSREEIRAYLVREMNEDKNPQQRYADQRSAEAFGLLPHGFDLDSFMVDLLTEQIAGLYDPKAHEFYVADWIPIDEQRMVMAHELTHALEDQHFQIEAWEKAARPNDDAELARESVLEGSAMAAMVEYLLQGSGRSLDDLPDIDPSMLIGDLSETPELKKAPAFLRDALVFPYIDGLRFSAAVLKPAGWQGLSAIFAKPPATTQQIMHPELYRQGKTPAPIVLPVIDKSLGADWKKLDENILGEFGWKEVLKQFLDADRANSLAAAWDGDRYSVYEQKQTKRLLLVTRERLANEQLAERFFGQYSEALEKKYDKRKELFRRPGFFSFDTPDGGVFLRCFEKECITLEGGDRSLLIQINKQLSWPPVPEQPREIGTTARQLASIQDGQQQPALPAPAGRETQDPQVALQVTPGAGPAGSDRPWLSNPR